MKNPKVVFASLVALVFMVLTFTVNWMFIIGAAVLSWWSWRDLFKK
jgi:hypothetical protein